MNSHSFFTRLFLGNLLLIGILLAVGGFVSYRGLNETYLADQESHQRQVLRFAQRHVAQLWPAGTRDAGLLDAECKELMAGSVMRLTVIADDGRVLGDSEADPGAMKNHRTPDRPEVVAALKGLPGRAVHSSETLGVEFRYLALPVRHDGRVAGVVRVAMPVVAIVQSGNLIRDALIWAGLAALSAALLLALLLSWIWYAPLRQITQTARTIAAGDLSKRAAISGSAVPRICRWTVAMRVRPRGRSRPVLKAAMMMRFLASAAGS